GRRARAARRPAPPARPTRSPAAPTRAPRPRARRAPARRAPARRAPARARRRPPPPDAGTRGHPQVEAVHRRTAATPVHHPVRPSVPGMEPSTTSRLARHARTVAWRSRFVVAALCCGLAAGITVDAMRPEPPATREVVVAARALP